MTYFNHMHFSLFLLLSLSHYLSLFTVNATATGTLSCPTPVCEVTAPIWEVTRWDQVKEWLSTKAKTLRLFRKLNTWKSGLINHLPEKCLFCCCLCVNHVSNFHNDLFFCFVWVFFFWCRSFFFFLNEISDKNESTAVNRFISITTVIWNLLS